MQQAIGAAAAMAVLGLLLVGPMVLAISAGADDPIEQRCVGTLGC